MKNRLQGFILGIIVSCVLLSSISVFADSINALFNVVNIKINGKQVANIGKNYTLDNGEEVPFSISYKGTTYLPMRKLGELLGKDVIWDGNTKTAGVNDKNNDIQFKDYPDGSRYFGDLKNGIREGYGILYYPANESGKRLKYVGEWRNDKRDGFATLIWANGDKYVGEFRNDLRDGVGIFLNSNGETTNGTWKDDKYLQQSPITNNETITLPSNNSNKSDNSAYIAEKKAQFEQELARIQQKMTNIMQNKNVQVLTKKEDGTWDYEYTYDENAYNQAQQEYDSKLSEYNIWKALWGVQ